jgi:hypothetical protein
MQGFALLSRWSDWTFIDRWTASGAAERANFQLFLAELCDVGAAIHKANTFISAQANDYVIILDAY